MSIVAIIPLVMVGIIIWGLLLYGGIKLCINNNAIGVIFLFFSLNFLGIIIGLALLYNANTIEKNKKLEKALIKHKIESEIINL